MRLLLPLLLLAVDLLAGGLAWLAFRQADTLATAYFVALLVLGVAAGRVLVEPPVAVDDATRRQQLEHAARGRR